VPKHGYAAGLASSSPLFPSCLPRAAKSYAAAVCVSSVLSENEKTERSMAVLASATNDYGLRLKHFSGEMPTLVQRSDISAD
jgi:hypothetical protein